MESGEREQGRAPWPAAATATLFVVVASCANLFIAVLDRSQFTASTQVRFSPPGYVVGAIWMVLFAFMGFAYHRLRWSSPQDRQSRHDRYALLLLVTLCALYPAYTGVLKSVTVGLFGVIVVLALNTWLVARLWRRVRQGAVLLLPLEAWLMFATYLLVAMTVLQHATVAVST